MALTALVPTGSAVSAEVVPRRRLVAAMRSPPAGVRQEDRPTGPSDADQLVSHQPWVGHVLEHVGREADVDCGVSNRQSHAAAEHSARCGLTAPAQLAEVGVDRVVRRSSPAERVGEVPRPATDVEHQCTAQLGVLPNVARPNLQQAFRRSDPGPSARLRTPGTAGPHGRDRPSTPGFPVAFVITCTGGTLTDLARSGGHRYSLVTSPPITSGEVTGGVGLTRCVRRACCC